MPLSHLYKKPNLAIYRIILRSKKKEEREARENDTDERVGGCVLSTFFHYCWPIVLKRYEYFKWYPGSTGVSGTSHTSHIVAPPDLIKLSNKRGTPISPLTVHTHAYANGRDLEQYLESKYYAAYIITHFISAATASLILLSHGILAVS
jgi:hypothetical protein